MKILSVFTPTYNRAYLLSILYRSLCGQTNTNFKWVIVDDGSTDDTEVLVEGWRKEGRIQIDYYKQSNGGKHRAYNHFIKICDTDLFICVDSDDYLKRYAVDVIVNCYQTMKDDNTIAGIISPKINKHQLTIKWPNHIERSSIKDLFEKYKYRGETALVFKTKLVKQYLYPEFDNERFILESIVYNQISHKFQMKLLRSSYYVFEYMEDGYTRNIDNVRINNPKGFSYALHQQIDMAENIIQKYKEVARYFMWCIVTRVENPFKVYDNKWMLFLSMPYAFILLVKKMYVKH